MTTMTKEDYIITKEGNVINKRKGNILKPQPNGKGYLRVWIGKRLFFVHRLVAEQYVPNPENKPQVNHKDGNKLNNHYSNLEWVTNKENRTHAVKNNLHLCGSKCSWSKLNENDVISILSDKEHTNKELAEKFNVSYTTITGIKNGYTWKQLKRYAELPQNEVVELEDKKPLG